jgi:diketogulonate reductase-like aldo/keto reductase
MESAEGETEFVALARPKRLTFVQGFSPLPKSVSHKRIEENADVFDFELTGADMEELDFKEVYAPSTWDPTVSFD